DVGGTLYFRANDGANGYELWRSDGTAAGISLVEDILPGGGGSNLSNLTDVGGTLYFSAYDGANGTELWRSDGTAAGTLLVADLIPGSGDGSLAGLTAIGDTVFFAMTDATRGRELWDFREDTTATVSGTVLRVTGDNQANSVTVRLKAGDATRTEILSGVTV